MEGARDYLARGVPQEFAPDLQIYAHSGAFPAWRQVDDTDAELELLTRFLRGASRDLRLTIGSGAVLVPDGRVGEQIADGLSQRGIPSTYRNSRRFELDENTVTVLPLLAAKGLEFPVVAVAGFTSARYPASAGDQSDEMSAELMVRERRTLFVAMTRAMRALLVITPTENRSELFNGFDPDLWNTGTA